MAGGRRKSLSKVVKDRALKGVQVPFDGRLRRGFLGFCCLDSARRWAAILAYSGLASQRIQSRPNASASTAVVPLPPQQSRTTAGTGGKCLSHAFCIAATSPGGARLSAGANASP